jgi:peptide-methionine (S)-S-oxide reductase
LTAISEFELFLKKKKEMKEATFGAGCFWCIEACFKTLEGVVSVEPGYMGGNTLNPTYKEVCSGNTGHAEVAKVVFDEKLISYEELLAVFWFVHDPTQLNRQGNDIGSQYRSVIFTHDLEQASTATAYKNRLEIEQVWENPIVTEIEPESTFYPAEMYHKDYFELNPGNAYCQAIVRPKVEKFKAVFQSKLKS